MALSPLDKAFYEEKLNWKSCAYLFASTCGIGAVAWPLLLFLQDWSIGRAGDWNLNQVFGVALTGIMFGMVVSAIMYLLFRFFLWMEWLPRRR